MSAVAIGSSCPYPINIAGSLVIPQDCEFLIQGIKDVSSPENSRYYLVTLNVAGAAFKTMEAYLQAWKDGTIAWAKRDSKGEVYAYISPVIAKAGAKAAYIFTGPGQKPSEPARFQRLAIAGTCATIDYQTCPDSRILQEAFRTKLAAYNAKRLGAPSAPPAAPRPGSAALVAGPGPGAPRPPSCPPPAHLLAARAGIKV